MKGLQENPKDTVNQFKARKLLEEVIIQEETETGNDPRECLEPNLPTIKESRGKQEYERIHNMDNGKDIERNQSHTMLKQR